MEPIFSLCIPTRARVDFVERLLRSLIDTTDNIDRVEVLFMIDDDDIISHAYLNRCIERFSINIRLFTRPQSEFLNEGYYNQLAPKATGRFCWILGDDLVFVKKGWDTLLINKINDFLIARPTEVLYISVKDDVERPPDAPPYANFPLISKEAIKVVGYFMPPTIPSWSGDYLIYLVYSHIMIGRVLEINELILTHTKPNHVTMIEQDGSSNRQRKIYSKYDVLHRTKVYEEYELPQVRGKLISYIKNPKNRRTYEPLI